MNSTHSSKERISHMFTDDNEMSQKKKKIAHVRQKLTHKFDFLSLKNFKLVTLSVKFINFNSFVRRFN